MKRTRFSSRNRISADATELARLATGISESGGKLEDAFWEARLAEVVDSLLANGAEDDLNAALDRLFDTNPVAQAALKALRDKTATCLLNKTAWMPSIDVSSEDFCGKGAEGGCDSFYYTSGGCNAVGGWGLMLDGDNFYCKAAFKLGATAGGGCGKGDRGYLNDCACSNETGELYYR